MAIGSLHNDHIISRCRHSKNGHTVVYIWSGTNSRVTELLSVATGRSSPTTVARRRHSSCRCDSRCRIGWGRLEELAAGSVAGGYMHIVLVKGHNQRRKTTGSRLVDSSAVGMGTFSLPSFLGD